jgi:hypothetical protein
LEDGTEAALPPVDTPSATAKGSPSRHSRNVSVRVVDALGNEIQQQATMTETTQEIEGSTFDDAVFDRKVVVQRMRSEITELARELEWAKLKCVHIHPDVSMFVTNTDYASQATRTGGIDYQP